MILGRWIRNQFAWPSLRLTADKDRCTSCRQCTKACPMSIGVTELVQLLGVDGSLWLGVGSWYLEGDADDGLFIGYAGPSAGWFFPPDSIVSVGAWLTAGMGGYVRTDPDTGDQSEGGFSVIEPEVCASVAITPSSRIGIPVEGTAAHPS